MPSGAAFYTSGPLTFANSKVDVGHALRHNRDYAAAAAAAASAAAARDTRLTPNLTFSFHAIRLYLQEDDKCASPYDRDDWTINNQIVRQRVSADARR